VLDRGQIVYDGSSVALANDPERMVAYFGASGQGADAEKKSR